MIDLHTHSTASDGMYSPSHLVMLAAEKNISVLALTDHDSIEGLDEARKKAEEVGITFVPGIEISIEWNKGEFHLLGLSLKKIDQKLLNLITFLHEERENRNRKIIQRLQENGIDISYEETVEKSRTKNIGRPHIAKILVEKKKVKKIQQAFDLYLANGRPCYVKKRGADLDKAVDAIRSSGGIPVQAHPLSMYVSWSHINDVIAHIKEIGVEGLEAYHPGAKITEAKRLEKLARTFDMIVTAGSDFHGEKLRADRKLGHSSGNLKIEDRFWSEELKPALEKKQGRL